MKYNEKLIELFVIFIVSSVLYFSIKIFFELVKVTQIEVRNEEEKVVEGFIGSILSLPFNLFKKMGESITDTFKNKSVEEIGTASFGFFCCCLLPLFLYWKFKSKGVEKTTPKIIQSVQAAASKAASDIASTPINPTNMP